MLELFEATLSNPALVSLKSAALWLYTTSSYWVREKCFRISWLLGNDLQISCGGSTIPPAVSLTGTGFYGVFICTSELNYSTTTNTCRWMSWLRKLTVFWWGRNVLYIIYRWMSRLILLLPRTKLHSNAGHLYSFHDYNSGVYWTRIGNPLLPYAFRLGAVHLGV